MQFIDHYSESEKGGGCMGTEWLEEHGLLTFRIAWLTGCVPPPSALHWEESTREYDTAYHWPGKRSKLRIRNRVSIKHVLIKHHCKAEKS